MLAAASLPVPGSREERVATMKVAAKKALDDDTTVELTPEVRA
jgi:hypothetical protein